RKLAYTIKKQSRGTFLLALFKVNPQQIAVIEREFNLSDQVLRAMFIAAEHMGDTEIEQTIEAGKLASDKAKLQEQETEDTDKQQQQEEESGTENTAIENSSEEDEAEPETETKIESDHEDSKAESD